nr:hypothetical protein [Halomarina sp. BCD28]
MVRPEFGVVALDDGPLCAHLRVGDHPLAVVDRRGENRPLALDEVRHPLLGGSVGEDRLDVRLKFRPAFQSRRVRPVGVVRVGPVGAVDGRTEVPPVVVDDQQSEVVLGGGEVAVRGERRAVGGVVVDVVLAAGVLGELVAHERDDGHTLGDARAGLSPPVRRVIAQKHLVARLAHVVTR